MFWGVLCFLKFFFVDLNKYNLVLRDYMKVLKNTGATVEKRQKSDVFKSIAKNQI